jgi:hypothetical protein
MKRYLWLQLLLFSVTLLPLALPWQDLLDLLVTHLYVHGDVANGYLSNQKAIIYAKLCSACICDIAYV